MFRPCNFGWTYHSKIQMNDPNLPRLSHKSSPRFESHLSLESHLIKFVLFESRLAIFESNFLKPIHTENFANSTGNKAHELAFRRAKGHLSCLQAHKMLQFANLLNKSPFPSIDYVPCL